MTITKKEIRLNLVGLAIAFIAQMFMVLSAIFYKESNTNIAFVFLAIAFTLLFIVFFIIFPMYWKA